MIRRIVSGGQTGADRAALDAAIRHGIPCGGWVPRGRRDEDGVIPAAYPCLVEAEDEIPATRTELNVRDSDASIILSHGPLFGGSAYTADRARERGKPCLHVDLARLDTEQAVKRIREWLSRIRPAVLNVAGPRASDDPEVYRKTERILDAVLRAEKRPRRTGGAGGRFQRSGS